VTFFQTKNPQPPDPDAFVPRGQAGQRGGNQCNCRPWRGNPGPYPYRRSTYSFLFFMGDGPRKPDGPNLLGVNSMVLISAHGARRTFFSAHGTRFGHVGERNGWWMEAWVVGSCGRASREYKRGPETRAGIHDGF